jgi:cytochrome c553
MSSSSNGRAVGLSVRAALFLVTPPLLALVPACADAGSTTEVPGASASAAATTGTTGGLSGVGGATAGVSGGAGATAGAGAAPGGAGGTLGGAGSTLGGAGGTLGGAGGALSGAGGALGGAGGAGGVFGGAAGALGGSAGSGGTPGGSAGAGGAPAGAAGKGAGGSAGFTPATDRTTAWNDPDYGCGNCHGEQGEGLAERGPEIRPPNRVLFDFMVRKGDAMPLAAYREGMPAATTAMISDAILDEIYTWLNSFPKPTTGAELYADYCGYCHGANGRGGTTQGYASASHSAPFDVKGAQFLQHVRDGHVRSGAGAAIDVSNRTAWMPPFPASVLTDQEVALIEAWLPKN